MSVTLGTIDIGFDGGQDSNSNPQRLRPPETSRAENVDYINDGLVHFADQIGAPVEGTETNVESYVKLSPYLASGAVQNLPILAQDTKGNASIIINSDNGLKQVLDTLNSTNQPWDIGEVLTNITLDPLVTLYSGAFNDNGDYCLTVGDTSTGETRVYVADSETLQFRLSFSLTLPTAGTPRYLVVGGGPICPDYFSIIETDSGSTTGPTNYYSFSVNATVAPSPQVLLDVFNDPFGLTSNITRLQNDNTWYACVSSESGVRTVAQEFTDATGTISGKLASGNGGGEFIAIDLSASNFPYVVTLNYGTTELRLLTTANLSAVASYSSATIGDAVALGIINGNVYYTTSTSPAGGAVSGLCTGYTQNILTSYHITGMPDNAPVLTKSNTIELPMGIVVNSLGFCVPALNTQTDGSREPEHEWYLTCTDVNLYLGSPTGLATGTVGNTISNDRLCSLYVYNAFTGVCVSRSWTNQTQGFGNSVATPAFYFQTTPYFYKPEERNLNAWTTLFFAVAPTSLGPPFQIVATRISELMGAGNHTNNLVGNQVYLHGANRSQTDGQTVHEMGYNDLAQPPILVPSNGAGTMTNGRYQYAIVYGFVDQQGLFHESGPRFTDITLAGTDDTVTVFVAGLGNLTQKSPVYAFIYRSANIGGPDPNPLLGLVNAVELPTDISYVSVVDTGSASVPSGPAPYFQVPTRWGNQPPINSAIGVVHKERLFTGVDRPAGAAVQYSSKIGLQVTTEATLLPRTPDTNNEALLQIPAHLGPLRGLASYGGSLVVLCAQGIATITGDGPPRDVADPTAGNSFTAPDVTNLGYGAISYMNVVVAQGVMYQSPRGIELFTGGQSQFVGAPIQNITSQHIFTNARVLPSLQVVTFFSNTFEGTLVFNFTQNKWAVWTNGAWKKAIDALDIGGRIVAVTRRVTREGSVLVTDARYDVVDGGTSIALTTNETQPLPGTQLVVETPWIPPGQIMGYGQMWELIFLGEYLAPHRITIETAANYGAYSDVKFVQDVTEIPPAGYIYRHRIPKPQVWSTRFRVTITPLGDAVNCVNLTGMMIFAGGDQGVTRLGAANSR